MPVLLPLRARRGSEISDGHYSREFKAHAFKVFLGGFLVSDDPSVMLATTLGSCVAACVWDPQAAVGGMNHFLLPSIPDTEADISLDEAARYGTVAMERLINGVLAAGGVRERLEVKVFGGARVIDSSMDIGELNSRFVLDYARREGFRVTGSDLGGVHPRRVHWFPATGRALRRLLTPTRLRETVREELDYRTSLSERSLDGEVEIFDEDVKT